MLLAFYFYKIIVIKLCIGDGDVIRKFPEFPTFIDKLLFILQFNCLWLFVSLIYVQNNLSERRQHKKY